MGKKADKQNKLKEVYPHVWEHYTHLNNERKRIEDKLVYLLALNALFIGAYIDFFSETFKDEVYLYMPLTFLIISIFTLSLHLFSKQQWVPWFDIETLFQSIDKNKFHERGILEIYDLAEHSLQYQEEKRKILRRSSLFTFLAAISLFLILIWRTNSISILKLAFSLTVIVFTICFFKWLGNKSSDSYGIQPPDKNEKRMKKWLKK